MKLKPPPFKTQSATSPIQRAPVLGVPVDIASRRQILDTCEQFLMGDLARHVVTVNPLLVLEAQKSSLVKKACQDASLMITESAGISWAHHTLSHPKTDRYPGIDLAFDVCKKASDLSLAVYFLGGQPGIAAQAAKKILRKIPQLQVGGTQSGYFDPRQQQSIINDIARTKARLILVGMSSPKQEIWIHQNLPLLPPGLYIGIGGTFDIWSEQVKRAPTWIQNGGMEWIYRWGTQPFRWPRMARLPLFAAKIIQSRYKH